MGKFSVVVLVVLASVAINSCYGDDTDVKVLQVMWAHVESLSTLFVMSMNVLNLSTKQPIPSLKLLCLFLIQAKLHNAVVEIHALKVRTKSMIKHVFWLFLDDFGVSRPGWHPHLKKGQDVMIFVSSQKTVEAQDEKTKTLETKVNELSGEVDTLKQDNDAVVAALLPCEGVMAATKHFLKIRNVSFPSFVYDSGGFVGWDKVTSWDIHFECSVFSVDSFFLVSLANISVNISSGHTIIWDHVISDYGGNYNKVAGTYTVPVDGYYQWG